VVEKEKLTIMRKRKRKEVMQNQRKNQQIIATITGWVRRRKRWKSSFCYRWKKTTTVFIIIGSSRGRRLNNIRGRSRRGAGGGGNASEQDLKDKYKELDEKDEFS
jgi:hypothetical protein